MESELSYPRSLRLVYVCAFEYDARDALIRAMGCAWRWKSVIPQSLRADPRHPRSARCESSSDEAITTEHMIFAPVYGRDLGEKVCIRQRYYQASGKMNVSGEFNDPVHID